MAEKTPPTNARSRATEACHRCGCDTFYFPVGWPPSGPRCTSCNTVRGPSDDGEAIERVENVLRDHGVGASWLGQDKYNTIVRDLAALRTPGETPDSARRQGFTEGWRESERWHRDELGGIEAVNDEVDAACKEFLGWPLDSASPSAPTRRQRRE